MRFLNVISTIALLILATLPLGSLPALASAVMNSLPAPITLEPWSPDIRSSNITSLSLFPIARQFPVRVNITNAGSITGFDVSLIYNITAGPNVLQAVKTGAELSGGLLDPDHPPAGCSIIVARSDIDLPAGHIRFAAVIQGGCSVNGTGTLFTILFRVTGIGATSIDIVLTNSAGRKTTAVIGSSPTFPEIPFQPIDAYFRNKPGTPPVAFFTYSPAAPILNQTVQFDASPSYDPDNSSLQGRGIRKFSWFFGDLSSYLVGEGIRTSHVFSFTFDRPAAGSFSVRLVVTDIDDNLPSERNAVVTVSPGLTVLFSLNWGGYAIEGPPGSVSDVKGSWKVPAIVGPCQSVDQLSSFWIGIDGLNSPTVEQVGTESACLGGAPTYLAWFEFFPKAAVTIRTITLHPGDIVSAEVNASSTKFNVSLTDLTTGESFAKSEHVKGVLRSSAEWIVEAPSSKTGILPLADFGKVIFGQDSTGVAGTCSATVGQTTGSIGSFGALVRGIAMIDSSLQIKVKLSTLSPDQTSFFVQWVSAT